MLLAALGARLADAGDRRRAAVPSAARLRRAIASGEPRVAGQRPRLLVLRVERAGEELAVAAEPDHHRVTLGAHLVAWPGREVRPAQLLRLAVDEGPERHVEVAHHGPPRTRAAGDLVEVLLHPRRELEVHEIAEVADEQVGHDLADRLRVEPALLHDHVAAVDDRGDRRRVRRRPADAVLLERLDQARLGVARRRLGEVLLRVDGSRRWSRRPRRAAAACAPPPPSRRPCPRCRRPRTRRTRCASRTPAGRIDPRSARPSWSRAPSPSSGSRGRAARSGGRAAPRPTSAHGSASPGRARTTSAGSPRAPPARCASSS